MLFSLWQAVMHALQPVQTLRSMLMPHWSSGQWSWVDASGRDEVTEASVTPVSKSSASEVRIA